MKFESQKSENNGEGHSVLDQLKKEALELSNIALIGTNGTRGAEMPKIQPETWNENDGVIVFADKGGKTYATPASELVRHLLFSDETMKKDESIGVPHLNNKAVWGDEERRERMTSFKEWENLAQKRSHPMQENPEQS